MKDANWRGTIIMRLHRSLLSLPFYASTIEAVTKETYEKKKNPCIIHGDTNERRRRPRCLRVVQPWMLSSPAAPCGAMSVETRRRNQRGSYFSTFYTRINRHPVARLLTSWNLKARGTAASWRTAVPKVT